MTLVTKRFRKYMEVFMWCVLLFGVAVPSVRFQQLTIERSEANARRMSLTIMQSPHESYVRRIEAVHRDDNVVVDTDSFLVTSDKVGPGTFHLLRPHLDIAEPSIVTTGTGTGATGVTSMSGSNREWPRLENLIDPTNQTIISDVQFILDFAIIAHPKTATSNLQNWLRTHPEIQMHELENHALAMNKPAELVANLYSDLTPGWNYRRGYKAPRDLIIHESLRAIHTYWPTTKLIVGLRHPVLWFESFYNFRVHNGHKMPSPETLIGKLQRGMVGVATDESKFHIHLDNLGKTWHSADELKLLSGGNNKKIDLPKMRNPIFLYEVNQLKDDNETRAALFSSDLQQYLALHQDFQPISTKRGPKYDKAIEICESQHTKLRRELMQNARDSSMWIRLYFLNSPDVSVSSPDHFHDLLMAWMIDPCDA